MTLSFRDGSTRDAFTNYIGAVAWDDAGMLGLSPMIPATIPMNTFNTEANITALLVRAGGMAIPDGYATVTVGDLVAAAQNDMLILKGVHQPGREHITFGFSGSMYHLPVTRAGAPPGTYIPNLTSAITVGSHMTEDSHDGWTNVGR
ncbi:hypothetical protein BK666_20905 [Pseudomonas frederiksbergensis]|uniref:Uncharacterized protein n=1 Tax=Pseudomonas frederiksbergensis TaxID=104087 RepID=A0A423JZV0_9PSED|nr:hypothetical protein [Pseudomonas frederiksbergensis]RON43531.1 hypothetical protein BK666_20905 [Pseudomonas frederiksbergensis]